MCSWHGFTYIRGWMQMVLHQMIYFPETIIQWNTILAIYMSHYCRLMHNDTYSVHDSSLKPWWSRLPRSQTFYYVFSPPLSRLNWCSLSPIGGPGPPTPKVASPLLGSPHTPFPGSRTIWKPYNGTDGDMRKLKQKYIKEEGRRLRHKNEAGTWTQELEKWYKHNIIERKKAKWKMVKSKHRRWQLKEAVNIAGERML
jgi:hypothetical protein